MLSDILGRAMRDFAKSELGRLQDEISEPLKKSLAELAKDEPLLAFKLKGRDGISTLVNLSKVLDEKKASISEQEFPFVQRICDANDDFSRNFGVDFVEKSIRSVAWSCGSTTWLSCLWRLHRTRKQDAMKTLDEMIEPLINEVSLQITEYIKSPKVA
jgi:hypothetical protein